MVLITVVLLYFGLLFIVSRWTGRRATNDTFYRAERRSPWYMVAFGMVGASISGVTFVSVPGMVMTSQMSSADVHGFLPGLSCDSFCVAAIVLQDESYVYLCLFGPTIRSPVAQDGRVVLPLVKDDGWCRQVLRGVCYFAGLYLRSHGYSFCRDGGCDGLADMALYEAWGY